MKYNADCADDADTRGYVKIRAIHIIRVLSRDVAEFSSILTGMAELCAFCGDLICGL